MFDDALSAVTTGLKDGSIPALKRELHLLDSGHMTRPIKSFKRWVMYIAEKGHAVYVCEDGTMAQLMKHYPRYDDICRFLPVKIDDIGDAHVRQLQSLLATV